MTEINQELTKTFREEFLMNRKQVALQRGVVKNGIVESAENVSAHVKNAPVFSIDLTTGKVSDQKQSGRCWMFAALNTFRHKMITSYQLKDFELSQNYTFFWDKYEKANYFYQNILNTAKEPTASREVVMMKDLSDQSAN